MVEYIRMYVGAYKFTRILLTTYINELLLDQIFSSDAVVLESICYHMRANRLINDSKTTRGLRKIWTGNIVSYIYESGTYTSVVV